MQRVGCSLLLLFLLLSSVCGLAAGVNSDAEAIARVVERYRDKVESRLVPLFQFTGVDWPPQELQLVAIKETRRLELWARSGERWHYIRDYRIKGMSGRLGPKLKEGDRQVPEGSYRVTRLNPNSSFHLSLKVDYPNAFDRAMAKRDGRHRLGGDIFIHGDQVSSGCLAIGDRAIEELFVLAALLGTEHMRLLVSPIDFRIYSDESLLRNRPDWIDGLYRDISQEMRNFQRRQ